jgi:hypothetical protein
MTYITILMSACSLAISIYALKLVISVLRAQQTGNEHNNTDEKE